MGAQGSTMKICVFGLWHLGSVTAACMADLGHKVIGLDFNQDIVDNLQNSVAPLLEPGLNELIQKNILKGRLLFTSNQQIAFHDTDVLWITFDTPVDEHDDADVQSVLQSFESIAEYINDQSLVIISSQVPVGTTRSIMSTYHENHPNITCFFAYSPENLRLGRSIKNFLEPDRIIIGTVESESEKFFTLFSSINNHLEWMGIESAEMTKHAINAFLALSVTYANEISTLCEYVGADAREVERGLKTEDRIGPKAYLSPGNAFSGGTLGRDIRFLQRTGESNQLPTYLMHAVTDSNNYHKDWVRRKCLEKIGDLKGKTISVLGLTYKPGTNTLRRSLSVELCIWLSGQGARVKVFDPVIHELPSEFLPFFSLTKRISDSITEADAIIVSTEWPEFLKMSAEDVDNMAGKIIIDPTGFLKSAIHGLQNGRYFMVGRNLE